MDNLTALLTTGDEILHGDILNTNSKEIAYYLFNRNIPIGAHMVVSDQTADITKAIRYLLHDHRILIITGGLGPTSDDRTRYALADAVNRPLTFDENTWADIVLRLKNLGYQTPPDTNRQQALFPEGATIIPNINGTACGCFLTQGDRWIFMLPGPPVECFPMLEDVVFPLLQKNHLQNKAYYQKWLLFGVSEGQIAEELDALTQSYDCITGYRLAYPYIEFKIFSHAEEDFKTLLSLVQKAIAPFTMGDGQKTASEILKEKLMDSTQPIYIADRATGGSLEAVLRTPKTNGRVIFVEPEDASVEIHGLEEFWQGKEASHTSIRMKFNGKEESHRIPYRGLRTKPYAVEFICREIVKFIECRVD